MKKVPAVRQESRFQELRTQHVLADAPFIELHLSRAGDGDYRSIQWLRVHAIRTRSVGGIVPPHVWLFLAQTKQRARDKSKRRGIKLSVRRSLQREGCRGKRGPGVGEHRQLYLAREMWKRNSTGQITGGESGERVRS